MASLVLHGDFVACVTGPNVLVYHMGTKDKQIYKIEKEEKTKAATEDVTRDDVTADEPVAADDQEHGAGDDVAVSDDIMAAVVSTSGRYFAACDNRKQLALWETGRTWTCKSVRTLKRRCLSLTFSQNEDRVIVADKSGDAYSFSVTSPSDEGMLLLGHVSMLLDLALCGPKDKFLVTADRDEKIRVSNLPNAYNVHTFCLGHSEFVTRLLYLREEDILLSGSGDGTVRLWNYSTGQELHCANCSAILDTETDTTEELPGQGCQPAATGEGQSQGQHQAGSEDTGHGRKGADGKNVEAIHKSDVKCVAFDKTRRLVAVGFDRSSAVLVYQLQSEASSHALKLAQRIDLEGTLWDLTFDLHGNLWTLEGSEGGVVKVHRAETSGEQLTVMTAPDVGEDDPIEITTHAINADWEHFKSCLEVRTLYAGLHKPKLNPAPMYYERKNKRLAEGGKRKATTEAPSTGDGKNQDGEQKKTKVDS